MLSTGLHLNQTAATHSVFCEDISVLEMETLPGEKYEQSEDEEEPPRPRDKYARYRDGPQVDVERAPMHFNQRHKDFLSLTLTKSQDDVPMWDNGSPHEKDLSRIASNARPKHMFKRDDYWHLLEQKGCTTIVH